MQWHFLNAMFSEKCLHSVLETCVLSCIRSPSFQITIWAGSLAGWARHSPKEEQQATRNSKKVPWKYNLYPVPWLRDELQFTDHFLEFLLRLDNYWCQQATMWRPSIEMVNKSKPESTVKAAVEILSIGWPHFLARLSNLPESVNESSFSQWREKHKPKSQSNLHSVPGIQVGQQCWSSITLHAGSFLFETGEHLLAYTAQRLSSLHRGEVSSQSSASNKCGSWDISLSINVGGVIWVHRPRGC